MSRTSTVAFVPRNRMARILSGPDRRAFADHVAGAEQAVAAIAPGLAERLRLDVESLLRLCRQEEEQVFGQCREIGRMALDVVEIARLNGRPDLAEAAEGLWEMIDALCERGVWHTDALRLHADALAGLAQGVGERTNGSAVTHELLRMREAIRATPTP